YVVIPNAASLNAATVSASEAFAIAATANGLSNTKDLIVSVGIEASLPGAPTGLSATEDDGAVDLGWNAPEWLGGDITGYKIESSADGATWDIVSASTGSSDTSFRVDGLANGTDVQFRVTAINSSGAGPSSDPVSATPRTVASAPTITSIVAGNKMLTVNFSAPTDDGGAIITGYEYSVDGGVTWSTRRSGTTESPLVIGPLANGTTFPVMVRAVNEAGAGSASNQVPATPVTAPVLPVNGGPAAPTGQAVSLVDGQPQPITVSTPPIGYSTPAGTQRFSDSQISVDLFAIGENGKSLELDASGRLVLVAGSFAEASGHGFLPGSTVDVWLMSTPVLLGTITVGADGRFAAKLPVPADVAPGPHTIQLNGIAADSSVRTLSVGVVVRAAVKAVDTTKGSAGKVNGKVGATAKATDPATGRHVRTPSASKLAFTGGYAALVSLLGLTLIGAGLAFLGTGRRRMSSTH
ncbi:MAG TPA: fibronectin type III domain-containing protein, partial [Microthrixaceae bacterium]|nr:fibronectin type III domain-containing protein [Microthrixaceae bacterium]